MKTRSKKNGVKELSPSVLYEFAGMAGFGAASFHLSGKLLPVSLAFPHASVAIFASILLAVGIFAY